MAAKKSAKKATGRRSAASVPTRKPATRRAAQGSGKRGKGKPGSATTDRVAEIQRVIEMMVEAGAVEIEMEEAGSRLRVRLKDDSATLVGYPSLIGNPSLLGGQAAAGAALPPGAPAPAGAPGAGAAGGAEAPHDDGEHFVFRSPMVGTFYRAASPDAAPYVEVGQRVTPDSTLCILEAMKVMNEIKAEVQGEVVEILAQNGEPVEFGQPLFVIRVA